MTASSVSVLDGVSGIDAARLIELWREALRCWDDPEQAYFCGYWGGRFAEFAVQNAIPDVALIECKRLAAILEAS